MPPFQFDEAQSFQANLEVFLDEMEGDDPEMASILRANMDKLASVVEEGQTNRRAREEFNRRVLEALERLLSDRESE
jgi:hypothetical protein